MRFSTVAIVASFIAAASAIEYPFKPNGPCVMSCLETAGKEMFPNFSMDPNSPYFMESLGYAHNRGTTEYSTYMGKTGLCNSKCPQAEQDLYNQQYPAKNDWYVANKSGGASATGAPATGSASAPAKTSGVAATSSAPAATGSATGSAPAPKPTGAASGVVASTGLIGAAAIGAAALLF